MFNGGQRYLGGASAQGGPDSTLRPPKAADETPHFGAEGAEILKKTVFLAPKTAFLGKKGPKLAFFRKIVDFLKILALMKPHRPKKWPKNAIKMKISGVDETPQKASPPPIPLILKYD